MKDGQHPEARTQLRLCHIDDGLTCHAQENAVEGRRRVHAEDVERRRDGEDGVKVRNVEDLGATCFEPALARLGSAAGAVTIAAGVPEDMLEAAAVTVIAMTAESGRAAIRQSAHHPELMRRERVNGVELGRPGPDDRAESGLGVHRPPLRCAAPGRQTG